MNRAVRILIHHPRKIVGFWCVLALAGGYLGSHLNTRLQNGGYEVSGSASARVVTLGREKFHDKSAAQAYVSVIADGGSLSTLLHDSALLIHTAQASPGVDAVGSASIAPNHRAALIAVMFDGSVGAAQLDAPKLERAIRDTGLRGARAYLIGQVPIFNRYEVYAKHSLQKAALIAFPVTLAILLVAFQSVAAAALPLLLAVECVGVTLGLLDLLSYFVQLNVFVEDTVLILGLGLSIDFSLFLVTRVRERLTHDAASGADAVAQALRRTGRAIVVSALTVSMALAGLFVAGVGFLSSLAIGAIGATVVVAAAAVTLTPATMLLVGDRLERLPVGIARSTQGDRLWRALAVFVVRRKRAIVALTVPVLVLASLPLSGLAVRFRTFSILPRGDAVRTATIRTESIFGRGFGSPVVVLAKTSTGALEGAIEHHSGIIESSIAQRGADGWSRLTAVVSAHPDTVSAESSVRALRASLVGALGPTAVVGGPTAEGVDLADRINTRTPLVVGVILLVELLLLTAAFRAPVIALKAALTTLISVTASLGILSLLFGGSGQLAYFVPLFLLAAVFGLSTDYEIFLLSRMREYHQDGESTPYSVRAALVRSARSITLAGATMSVVFFAFASSDLTPYRQLGVGLGLAVLLDVTVMRSLLVPATVALLGETNWWRPRLPMRARADAAAGRRA